MMQATAERSLSDDDRMQEDVWHLHEFDLYREIDTPVRRRWDRTTFQCSDVIDFTIIHNTSLREEAKAFYRYHLEQHIRLATTLISMHSSIIALLSFMDELDVKQSLLELPLDTLTEEFRHYHYTKLNHVTLSRIEALDVHQKPVIYIEDADTINAIKKIYHFLEDQRDAHMPEMEKDVWDVRKLPFPVEVAASRKRTKIVFTAIQQPMMREVVKQYIYERLKVRKLSCVLDDMKGLKLFASYLAAHHAEIHEFSELSRDVVLQYLGFLNQQPFAMTTKRARKGVLDTFFKTCQFLEIGNLPDEQLIRPSDHYHKNKFVPRLIPDCALRQLNEHLDDLPRPIRIMTIVLENTGMRVNEACQLRVDCLKEDTAGDPYLQYFQSKTSHINRIPITHDFAKILQEQIRYVHAQFPDSVYLITMDGIHPVQQDTWSFHINRMAFQHHITDETGNLFRFQAHQFRHTVATRYAMEGMSPNMIRSMLGHQDMKSIASYIEIRDVMANQKLRAFIQQEGKRYKELRRADAAQPASIPLAYGYCSHQDLCDTALACYACGMFQMDDVDRTTVQRYLDAIDGRIQSLHMEQGSRQMEIYQVIREKLQEALAKP